MGPRHYLIVGSSLQTKSPPINESLTAATWWVEVKECLQESRKLVSAERRMLRIQCSLEKSCVGKSSIVETFEVCRIILRSYTRAIV